jgi:hypothetical protein
VSFAAITRFVASQRVFVVVVVVVVVYFVIDSVRKLLDTPSYVYFCLKMRRLTFFGVVRSLHVSVHRSHHDLGGKCPSDFEIPVAFLHRL